MEGVEGMRVPDDTVLWIQWDYDHEDPQAGPKLHKGVVVVSASIGCFASPN